jgi:hypothetical protein
MQRRVVLLVLDVPQALKLSASAPTRPRLTAVERKRRG